MEIHERINIQNNQKQEEGDHLTLKLSRGVHGQSVRIPGLEAMVW